jgi:serine O-acetyltransferase
MKFACFLKLVKNDLKGHGGVGFLKGFLIFFFNQPFRLLLNYRFGNYLHHNRNPFYNILILILKKVQIQRRNCDISYSASIGGGVKFPHPLSIVIGDFAKVGEGVMIWQNVTLGSSGRIGVGLKYPTIGEYSRIYAGAVIIGGVQIGQNAIIGANSVVRIDLPDNSVAAGAPARVVKIVARNNRSVPNFLLGGIMKSGTTNLDDYLRMHPDIYMLPRSMATSFFDNNDIYANGIEWYNSLFRNVGSVKLIGQTSADCAFNDQSVLRIKEHIPDCKLIFILRNPIDRGYSQYWHQIKMAREYRSWEGVISAEERRMKRSYFSFRMFSYISRGKYKSQFDRYFNHFPKEQIMLIPFEFMMQNEFFVVNRVLNFLGLDTVEKISDIIPDEYNKKTNPAMLPGNKIILYLCYFIQSLGFIRISRFILNMTLIEKRPPKMNIETRKKLESFFKDDIEFHNEISAWWEKELKGQEPEFTGINQDVE